MRDGSPAFVTVMAPTDEPGGWRKVRNDSGAVLDVASGEAVTTGLAMPHSPRWHDGNLFVLNSGMGRLERVDPATGHREAIAAVPGYARGLAFHRDLAFVGLSRIRETAIFGGAPIAAYHDQLKCGVGVIELSTGDTVATLQFANGSGGDLRRAGRPRGALSDLRRLARRRGRGLAAPRPASIGCCRAVTVPGVFSTLISAPRCDVVVI